MTFNNACSLGPQSESEAAALNLKRIDCLAAYKLKTERDNKKLTAWFNAQPEQWKELRGQRFFSRVRSNDAFRY